MKKVIVVDWLDKYGGAERVITSLFSIFEFKKCYTLINLMTIADLKKMLGGSKVDITTTWLKVFGNKFRYLLFLFPFFIKKITIDPDTDLIISSSHAIAKGIKKTNVRQLHICYFQARNLKYIWSETKLYFGFLHYLLYPIIVLLRRNDINNAQLPDYIIANSKFVQNWIKETYNRDSDIIYPPVDLSQFSLVEDKEDYFVAVGRIEPYKRFDIIVDAFNKLPHKKIKIIGDGSQLSMLKKKANSNIEFLGFLESKEVFQNIKQAKGFVHAGIEDFGIAPIEAQACGTPVIAYGYGGVLETVISNKTGVFFNEMKDSSLIDAVSQFENICFNYIEVRKNALKFSQDRFENEIKCFVDKKYTEFNKLNIY